MRFTVTEFDWPYRWFAVRDRDKQYHVSSHGSRAEAQRRADDLNKLHPPGGKERP